MLDHSGRSAAKNNSAKKLINPSVRVLSLMGKGHIWPRRNNAVYRERGFLIRNSNMLMGFSYFFMIFIKLLLSCKFAPGWNRGGGKNVG